MVKTIKIETYSTGSYASGEHTLHLLHCDKHSDSVWHYAFDRCPACREKENAAEDIKKYRKTIRELRKDIKLLKYELQEERTLHKGTQLDAAEYLAQKKLVDNLVRDRIK